MSFLTAQSINTIQGNYLYLTCTINLQNSITMSMKPYRVKDNPFSAFYIIYCVLTVLKRLIYTDCLVYLNDDIYRIYFIRPYVTLMLYYQVFHKLGIAFCRSIVTNDIPSPAFGISCGNKLLLPS